MQLLYGRTESYPIGVVQYRVLRKMKHPLSILLALAFHQRPISYQFGPGSGGLRKTNQKGSNSNTCEK